MTTLVNQLQNHTTSIKHPKESFSDIVEENKSVENMENELYTYLTTNANEKLSTIPGVIDPYQSDNFYDAFNNGSFNNGSFSLFE